MSNRFFLGLPGRVGKPAPTPRTQHGRLARAYGRDGRATADSNSEYNGRRIKSAVPGDDSVAAQVWRECR